MTSRRKVFTVTVRIGRLATLTWNRTIVGPKHTWGFQARTLIIRLLHSGPNPFLYCRLSSAMTIKSWPKDSTSTVSFSTRRHRREHGLTTRGDLAVRTLGVCYVCPIGVRYSPNYH